MAPFEACQIVLVDREVVEATLCLDVADRSLEPLACALRKTDTCSLSGSARKFLRMNFGT
jgi:hypothetical protein